MVKKQQPSAEIVEPRTRIILGKTYIETLLLTLLTNMLTMGVRYEDAVTRISDLLLEEVEVLGLRMPEIRDLFREYLLKTFKNSFGEKIPPPAIREGDVKIQLIEHMREHVEKIIPDYSQHESSYINEKLSIIASRMIVVASKAVFRDLGYIR